MFSKGAHDLFKISLRFITKAENEKSYCFGKIVTKRFFRKKKWKIFALMYR